MPITGRPVTNDTNEIRTRDTTVKGWCLNRLTMVPFFYGVYILTGFSGTRNKLAEILSYLVL